MENEEIVDRIKRLCKEKGVSVNKAELESGAGKGVLNNFRHGSIPSASRVNAFASYLGVTSEYILTGKSPAPSGGVNIHDAVTQQGNTNPTTGGINSAPARTSADKEEDEDAEELLRIYRKLDRRGKVSLLHAAYIEEEKFDAKN